jgi:hypothetical protein
VLKVFSGLGRRLPSGIPGRYALESFVRRVSQALVRRKIIRRYSKEVLEMQPIVLGISIPKSGTNLLRQVLGGLTCVGPYVDVGGMTIVTFEPESGMQRPISSILSDIARLNPGDIASAHLHAEEEFLDYLAIHRFAPIFIMRDPRDVVVSHMHYVTHMRRAHVHHEYYAHNLHTDEARLLASITGYQSEKTELPNIYERTKPYLGWVQVETVLTIKFEEILVSPHSAMEKILRHLKLCGCEFSAPDEGVIQAMIDHIDPMKSKTFREGKVGAWRDVFTERINGAFNEVGAELLERMGYV